MPYPKGVRETSYYRTSGFFSHTYGTPESETKSILLYYTAFTNLVT